MRLPILLFSLTCCQALLHLAQASHPTDFEKPLTMIAFGSCNRQNIEQPLWPVIQKNKPDLWIWAGDNIYADWRDYSLPVQPKVTVDTIRENYAEQLKRPDYTSFRASVPIIGTWDDHDFGQNNAGAEYPLKSQTAILALDFMDVPAEDPRRKRDGIYGAYDFGPEGKRVKVILFDNRYFASNPQKENADLLGQTQRDWLEQELKKSTAQVHIFVSGTQIISQDHRWEKWANFPADHTWFLNLLETLSIPGALILSGDRHIHELSVREDLKLNYPLIDLTSSGLTHSWEEFGGEPNRYRVGGVYTGLGFGLVKIDWSESQPIVQLEIRTQSNKPVLNYTVEF